MIWTGFQFTIGAVVAIATLVVVGLSVLWCAAAIIGLCSQIKHRRETGEWDFHEPFYWWLRSRWPNHPTPSIKGEE